MITSSSDTVSLFVVEEQEIYREIYSHILPQSSNITILRVDGRKEREDILKAVSGLAPDVILLSIKKLNSEIIGELEHIRNAYPRLGMVILIVSYSLKDIDQLRRLATRGESGMALFFKQSLDKADQLSRIVIAVSQGQVILDPPLAAFMFAGKPECPFLKQLTVREMEILGLLAQGYTNAAISETLFIDVKTVEHHLNSMYSKLKEEPYYSTKHLRVSAARLYLETMGMLYQPETSFAFAAARS